MQTNKKLLVLIFVLIFLVSACTTTPDTADTDNNNSVTTTNNTQTSSPDNDDTGVVEVSINMAHFSFTPNVINANAGDTVKVTLINLDGDHDFVIDELDVDSGDMDSDETKTIEFTIPEDASGETYTFYCSVSNHRALGMEGTLVIN